MFSSISITPMYVTDHDEALDFYVDTLGFELTADVAFGPMRWVTIALPGQPGREVMLQRIGDVTPTAGPETAEMLRELTERGASSWMILTTDDCHQTHKKLAALGVTIVQEPQQQMYGVDMAIRDPFGNQIRITELPAGE